MKKVLKSTLGVAAAAAIVGANVVATTAVLAYGDNSGRAGYRQEYTIDQINNGALGATDGTGAQKIVLNSITDNPYGNEFNFVSARKDDGTANGAQNIAKQNTITAENGETYWVYLYVHNNNPNGTKAVAKDVAVKYTVPGTTGTKVTVQGTVTSSNAYPTKYWDTVDFVSDHAFHLEYVAGSGLLQNNYTGANKVAGYESVTGNKIAATGMYTGKYGFNLSDDIVKNGTLIGFNGLNGEVPGCFTYDEWVGIKVKVVYDEDVTPSFTVNKKVRLAGTKDKFAEEVTAKVGDKVEYKIEYHNTSDKIAKNVTLKDALPKNAKLVPGTVKLYNSNNENGLARDDASLTTGVAMGDYAPDAYGYIYFTAEIVDNTLVCGKNRLMNWGLVGVSGTSVKDNADVIVEKACADQPSDTTTTDDTVAAVTEIPSTGPAAIATGVIGAGSVVTTAGYYVASRKKLNK